MSIFDDLDLGNSPNDKTGDELREAGQKINDNNAKTANLTEDNEFTGDVIVNGFFGMGVAIENTIASGSINVVNSNLKIKGEGDAPDQLDTINSSAVDGDILILRTFEDAITVSEIGNIILGATTRVLVTAADKLILQFSGINWIELSFADNT